MRPSARLRSGQHPQPARTAVMYVRVSSKEQEKEGFSIPAQRKLLQQYALERGLEIVREFEDVETAKRSGRQAFTEMVAFLATSSCKVVLVEKTDRLYRNKLLSNCTFNRGSLVFGWVKPFDLLARGNESGDWLGGRDSNSEPGVFATG